MTRRHAVVATALIAPAVGVLALLGYGFGREPRYIETLLLGRAAAPFSLTLFDGGTLHLEHLRGKVVFLNFWASWCPPGRAEAPALEAAWRQWKARDVVFLGLATQDEEPASVAFLREFDITYPNGRDVGGRIAIDYGVWGLPEAYVIDRKGRITYKHIGTLSPALLASKLEEATRGVVSASQGRGDYQSTR
jgi:cytochrome c biogenesis protein CcmG/thiol:disulfide interchange protein DsbE